MKVHVQFFSRIRDLAGVSEMELDVPEKTTAADLLELLYARNQSLRGWDKSILVAAGVEFVDRDYLLQSADQISIMPPVQGG
ncbi:MAG: molybdopterin synthase sulfur carrier subunit [Verrucomicrobiota bacterium]|jgi:molybdopterin converting factor small subunit